MKLIQRTPRERNMADIGLIALKHGFQRGDIFSKTRNKRLTAARRECAQFFRDQGKSYPEIGRIMDRHHSSIISLIGGKYQRPLDESDQVAQC